MSVKIIVDSTADVSSKIRDRLIFVPLTLRFGEEEFLDGVTIDYQIFYEKLIESDVLPTTSQATPAAFQEVLDKALSPEDTAVLITLSGKLSGTHGSAVIAAEEYNGRIYVVDGNTAAIGTGILAEYALRLLDEGKSAEEIADILNTVKDKIRIVALLDTLEYLKRGGRISKSAAFAGGLLSIKPVICLEDGEIKVLGKARGSKQGNNLLSEQIQKAGGGDFSMPVLLGYTGLSDVMLRKYIEDSRPLWDSQLDTLNVSCIGSVIGTHIGPGAIAVAFFVA